MCLSLSLSLSPITALQLPPNQSHPLSLHHTLSLCPPGFRVMGRVVGVQGIKERRAVGELQTGSAVMGERERDRERHIGIYGIPRNDHSCCNASDRGGTSTGDR